MFHTSLSFAAMYSQPVFPSAFYPSLIIVVVFLDRTIFQLDTQGFKRTPTIWAATTSRGCFHNRAQNNHVSTMIRAMHCLM